MSEVMLHHPFVSRASQLLALNLERARLLSGDPPLSQNAFAKVIGLQQRTYNRIVRGDVDASLETLETVAKALGVQPWQLLVDNFDPHRPPELAVMGDNEREFYAQLRALAKKLNISN